MDRLREPNPCLAGLEPYDPKYLPAEALMSANENPLSMPEEVRAAISEALAAVALNRYPDPLANGLRDALAERNGVARDQVLVGNGGDELLFDLALAWGGPGRTLLNLPPTFSVYAANARLTGTEVVDVPRRADFTIDEEAVLARLASGAIDMTIVTSPNNPTGQTAPLGLVERMLEASDALVLVDEAYCEFSGQTALPLLERHRNLAILRTFSKAYGVAGVRLGYLLADAAVITELCKVRQPYSVDALSQAVGCAVIAHQEAFAPGIALLVAERDRLLDGLRALPGVQPFPSDANWVLFRLEGEQREPDAEKAAEAWGFLYDRGILVRDFSRAPGLEGCLRATVGTPEQNDSLLEALAGFLGADAGSPRR